MNLPLTKTAETASTITLTWTPPAGAQWYTFYIEGVRVSNAPPADKNGVAKTTVKFAAGANQYQVVALCQAEGVFSLAVGTWDKTPPPPPPPPPAGSTFMSYPASQPISLTNVTGQTIERLSFTNTPAGRSAIVLNGCHDITIRSCDFRSVPGCVYAVNCTNIVLDGLRYENITGPSVRTGANVGNLVQFNHVTGGAVRNCKGKGGDTEDIISVYASWDIVVEDNHFQGTNWISGSGSGIALGDNAGGRNIARRNILVNVGQVGAFIAGGINCRIEDNTIIGVARPKSNVGIYVWAQGGGTCSGHTVARNKVSWKRADGVNNPAWDAGNCGPVTGWATNDWNAGLDANAYPVVL